MPTGRQDQGSYLPYFLSYFTHLISVISKCGSPDQGPQQHSEKCILRLYLRPSELETEGETKQYKCCQDVSDTRSSVRSTALSYWLLPTIIGEAGKKKKKCGILIVLHKR